MKKKNRFTTLLSSVRILVCALGLRVFGRHLKTGVAAVLMLAGVAYAQEPIVAIEVKPNHELSTKSVWEKPILIKSAEEAAQHFAEDALATLKNAVDWEKQVVLVFVWKGSGQDQLQYHILESYPEQIPFSLKPGMTKDLRLHSRVYALRSNVQWSVKLER